MGTLPNHPDSTDEQVAAELAEVLMRQALCAGGPLAKLAELARLLRVLRLAGKLVTARRDREAYCLGAVLPGRKIARHMRVTASTMQGWINAGGRQSTDVEV